MKTLNNIVNRLFFNKTKSDIKMLADILRVLVAQELGNSNEGTAKRLVYTKAYDNLEVLIKREER